MPALDRLRPGFADAARTFGVGVLLAILSYRALDFIPGAGLDNSWAAGLHLAAHSQLDWGPDLDFTYGPLGFLAIPKLYYDGTAVLAVMWLEFTRALALGAVFALARRGLGTVGAFALALLLGASLQAPEVVYAAAVSVALVSGDRRHRYLRPLIVSLGLLASVSVLVKLGTGISVGAIALLAVLTGPGTRRERRDDVTLLASSFVGPVLLLWLADGQSLGAIPQFVSASIQTISGYNAAMGTDDPTIVSDYTLALAVLVTGFVAIRLRGPSPSPRASRAAGAVWLLTCFLQFKAGFVRHDPGHALLLFGAAPAIVMVLVAGLRSRATAFGIVLAPLVILVSAGHLTLGGMWSPVEGVRATVQQIGDLGDSGFRARQREAGRRLIAAQDQVPKAVFDDVQGQSTYVYPAETAVVWAYGFRWNPLPAFQSYAAYTDSLDKLNAKRLADARKGPSRVLVHQEGSIDGRFLGFDEPQVTLTLLCRFDVSAAEGAWTSLARTADRCGRARVLSTVRTHWDRTIPVPAPRPGTAIVADVDGIQVGGLESVRSFAFKAHDRSITLGADPHRLIPGSGDGPLLLRAAPGLDLPAPANQIPQVPTIAFGKAGSSGGGDLKVTFSEIPFRRR